MDVKGVFRPPGQEYKYPKVEQTGDQSKQRNKKDDEQKKKKKDEKLDSIFSSLAQNLGTQENDGF